MKQYKKPFHFNGIEISKIIVNTYICLAVIIVRAIKSIFLSFNRRIIVTIIDTSICIRSFITSICCSFTINDQ